VNHPIAVEVDYGKLFFSFGSLHQFPKFNEEINDSFLGLYRGLQQNRELFFKGVFHLKMVISDKQDRRSLRWFHWYRRMKTVASSHRGFQG
jgi:hypothetical protein